MTEFSIHQINQAQKRLQGHAVTTPLLNAPVLDEKAGGKIFFKCENSQRTGSFKFRGAFNRLSMIPAKDRSKGVVAFSSGNHAQGVACAAKLLKIPATIFMPKDAPQVKVKNTKNYGATVKFYDRKTGDREGLARDFVARTGATFISPFDDFGIMAGQGTAGLEMALQLKALGIKKLDQVIIPVSGGGLTAGIGTALKHYYRNIQIITVEPYGYHDTLLSLKAGTKKPKPDKRPPSFCDALLAEAPGKLTFPVNLSNGAKGVTVTDTEVGDAMRFAFQQLKQVLEPGGSVALAAVLSEKMTLKNKTTAVVLSGGNVDAKVFAEVLGIRRC